MEIKYECDNRTSKVSLNKYKIKGKKQVKYKFRRDVQSSRRW